MSQPKVSTYLVMLFFTISNICPAVVTVMSELARGTELPCTTPTWTLTLLASIVIPWWYYYLVSTAYIVNNPIAITLRVPLQLLWDIMRLSLWCQHDKTIILWHCKTKIIQPVASLAFCGSVEKQESRISKASPRTEILIKNITKSLSHLHISRIKMHHHFVAIQFIMRGWPGII